MLSHGIEKLARHCSISERCAMCSRESDLAILIHGSSCAQALRNVDKSAGLPSKSPKGCWDLVNIVTAKIHKHSETMKPGTKKQSKEKLETVKFSQGTSQTRTASGRKIFCQQAKRFGGSLGIAHHESLHRFQSSFCSQCTEQLLKYS